MKKENQSTRSTTKLVKEDKKQGRSKGAPFFYDIEMEKNAAVCQLRAHQINELVGFIRIERKSSKRYPPSDDYLLYE